MRAEWLCYQIKKVFRISGEKLKEERSILTEVSLFQFSDTDDSLSFCF